MKVLLIVTSHYLLGSTGTLTGYYLPEVSHPYFELIEAGVEVDIASPQGGEAPIDKKSLKLEDSRNRQMWENPQHRAKLKNTLPLEGINPSDYDAVLFAGGHGTMWDFRENQDIQNVIRQVYENDGYVAAVCHGPAALVDVKLSNGKNIVDGVRVTGFSNAEEDIAELTEVMPFLLETELIKDGALYEKAEPWGEKVVIDQRIITGQNPASAELVGKTLLHALKANK